MAALASGTRLGPYEILDAIGAGGMGEVYRASDTRLKRQVALKVLPSSVTADAERLSRFQREAEVLASLNHPNIAGLHGLEESGGVKALVMELVEGPTLADRIAQGPIPIEEALAIARQIAEALAAAHDQNVIHRDLKPANVKVRPDGTVKVLDFGLAKIRDQGSGIGDQGSGRLANSPTITSPAMTMHGVILGTAAYMSPEQAAGKPVDKRSDLWAFGVVLMEMLTRKRVFDGETVSHVIASVLKDDPDWNLLPPATPPSIRRLLRRCLARDRQKRWPDAATARMECDDALASNGETAVIAGRSASVMRSPWHLPAGFVAGIAIAGVAAWSMRPAPPTPSPGVRFAIDLPPGQVFTRAGRHVLALSPDGMHLAFVANSQLFVRSLGELVAKPLDGTANSDPAEPIFSPDGQWIVFWSNSKLKRIPVDGGTAVEVAEIQNPYGISWSGNRILVALDDPRSIAEVPANGGAPKTLIAFDPNKDEWPQSPQLIDDGRAILFTLRTGTGAWHDASIVVQDLATSERTVLVERGTDGRVLPTGDLIYAHEDTLFGVALDEARRIVIGSAIPVLQDVLPSVRGFSGASHIAISNAGTIAFVPDEAVADDRQLAWLNRQGEFQPSSLPARSYWPGPGVAVSPDGVRVATRITGASRSESDIWVSEVGRNTLARLTLTGAGTDPAWLPDGTRVCYENADALFCQPSDGSAPPQLLFRMAGLSTITDVSPDGRSFLLNVNAPRAGFDIWIATNASPYETRPLIATPSNENNAMVSADGKWLAYQSEESGVDQVYVRPFPSIGDGRWQISTASGLLPRWSRDGKELYFLTSRSAGATVSQTLMAVPVLPGHAFITGPPRVIAELPPGTRGGYDVTPDGRFLVNVPAAGDIASFGARQRIVIVQHWLADLKSRMTAARP